MGVGRVSPDASVSRGENGQFESRESGSMAPLEAYSETLDGDSPSESKGECAMYLNVDDDPDMARAGVADDGYHEGVAAHFRSKSNEELRGMFEEKLSSHHSDSIDSPSDKSRFIGGVLVSRDDSSMSVEDVFEAGDFEGITVSGTDSTYVDNPKEVVVNEMDDMLSEVDEYVAGQILTEIDEVNIQNMRPYGRINIDPENATQSMEIRVGDATKPTVDPVGEGPGTYGVTDATAESVHDVSIDDRTSNSQINSTVRHEMIHAFHLSMNVEMLGSSPVEDDTKLDYLDPDELQLEHRVVTSPSQRSPVQEEFAEEVQAAADRIIETEKGEVPAGEPPMRTIRGYQKYSYEEVMTVGYELYSNDMIASVNEQRQLADVFDERLTGHGWEETTVDSLQDSTQSDITERNGVAGKHKPPLEWGDVNHSIEPSDYGEMALFEFEDDIFNGQSHAAGIVTDVSDDSVTFSYCAQEIKVDRDDIASVKRRDWNS